MARTVKYEFNPEELTGEEIPRGSKAEVRAEIADFILSAIIGKVSVATSPVRGHGAFKRLTKDYAKREKGGNRTANLELTGAMLEALEVKPSGTKIIVQTKGKQGDKADGHNNHSGESLLPLRRYIPDEGEEFKREIMLGVRRIILESQED